MKRLIHKTKSVVKGVPSAVILSALIHFILLSIAGGLIVFTVTKKEEKKFVPPPKVNRPKMELKKPQVKLKKTAPPPAARHIVSKNLQVMTDLQLPDAAGIGSSGLGSGLGGFGGYELNPDIGLFGGPKTVTSGNDMEGVFYSFRYDRQKREISPSPDEMWRVVKQFMTYDWNPRAFTPYYRAPQKLYTSVLMIPPAPSSRGPEAFGSDVEGGYWLVHYKGKIARKNGGRYRFWGAGDNFMILRVNKKVVLVAGFQQEPQTDFGDWRPSDKESGKHLFGHGFATVGDWFDLEPGVPVEFEAIFGDYEGGWFKAMVVVEDEKGFYDKNDDELPVLPAFKTAEIPEPLKEQIEYLLIRNEVTLDDDLIFNVY